MGTYTHTHIHTYTHTHTYIHTYIHTYMHTYIHTYLFLCRATSQTLCDAWRAARGDESGRTERSGPDKMETRDRSMRGAKDRVNLGCATSTAIAPNCSFKKPKGRPATPFPLPARYRTARLQMSAQQSVWRGSRPVRAEWPLDRETITSGRSPASARTALPRSRKRHNLSSYPRVTLTQGTVWRPRKSASRMANVIN